MSNRPTDTDRGTETTVTREAWLTPPPHAKVRTAAHALVIAWSLFEPERAGEVALLADDTPRHILGRGGPLPEDDAPRVRFVQHRPGGALECPPLSAPGLSRRQIDLTPSAIGVRFERTGRTPLLHNGVRADHGLLRAGDVLTCQNQLVLLCVRRSLRMPSAPHSSSIAFAEADADGIVGESESAWRLREELALVAPSSAHVLVLGESGVGKELAARAIHRLSSRARGPLVARSAAAIPGTLLDAELFGNRRDYPNAGMPQREGVIGAVHGGTLFLDEIGELGPELQTHLLRALDSGGEYHRLGESDARTSDFRLIAATNRPATALKHDFAARFAVRVTVPGMGERPEDVPLLARHLLDGIVADRPELRARFFEAGRAGKHFARLDPTFVELLLRRTWTHHVRELSVLLWSSIRESPAHYLVAPRSMEETTETTAPGVSGVRDEESGQGESLGRKAIVDALVRHSGNQSKAYVALGLSSRFALGRLLRKHGIDPRDPER